VERAATIMTQKSNLEHEKQTFEGQLEALKDSKRMIQKSLNDQMQTLKQQLDGLRDERRRCDDAVKSVTAENSRLQRLCAEEQGKNFELISKYKKYKLEGTMQEVV